MLRACSRTPSLPHDLLCFALGPLCAKLSFNVSGIHMSSRTISSLHKLRPVKLAEESITIAPQNVLQAETEETIGYTPVMLDVAQERIMSRFPVSRLKNTSEERFRLGRRPISPLGVLSSQDAFRQRFQESLGLGDEPTRYLEIMATSSSPHQAWHAYRTLMNMKSSCNNSLPPAPFPAQYLHRLARLLLSTTPRTRVTFLRLLAVLTTLRENGGRVHIWEWNALIDCASKGWRKTTMEDYRTALGVFDDMTQQSNTSIISLSEQTLEGEIRPDIWTFNTLLAIATRTGSLTAMQHAVSLLQLSPDVASDNVTQLTVLPNLIRTGHLESIRAILVKMAQEGYNFGIDGINAYIWALAKQGDLQTAIQLYHKLKQNRSINASDIVSTTQGNNEGDIIVASHLKPDQVTYTLLVQGLAYHGDLTNALTVVKDMLTDTDSGSQVVDAIAPADAKCYLPSQAIYRSLFLGFARHGVPPLGPRQAPNEVESPSGVSAQSPDSIQPCEQFNIPLKLSPNVQVSGHDRIFPSPQSDTPTCLWTLNTLDALFNAFLKLPSKEGKPNERTIYWIMRGYLRTSGNDTQKMVQVWERIEARFGPCSSRGRLADFAKLADDTGIKAIDSR